MASAARSARRPLPRRLGDFFFRWRDFLVPAAVLGLLAITRPRLAGGSPRVDRWVDLLGLLLAAAGQTVSGLVIGYAYVHRGGIDKQVAARRLVQDGFYAHCRNPIYLGNALLIVGLLVVYHSPLAYALALPLFFGGLWAIVKAEEAFLEEKFGDAYRDYCRRVPRFVPRLRGLGRTMRSMTFDWRRVLRKDYGTFFAWTATFLFLLVWERLRLPGYAASTGEIQSLLAAYVPLLGFYGAVRWLKKHRYLASPAPPAPGR